MKRLFLISLFITSLVSISVQAQTQQQKVKVRTRVTSDMKGGEPIASAEVKFANGNRHTSGQDGMFSFAVRGKFEIESATKQGYVMIDPKYLKGFTSYTPDAIPVIMEERNKLNRETERQTQRINKQLSDENERLMRLNDSLLAVKAITEAKYDSLEQARSSDYLSKVEKVREMAEAFANIDYEILEEYDRKVYRALSEGNYAEAYRLLKSHKSVEELKKEIEVASAAIDATEQMLANAKQGRDAKIKEAADQCYRWFNYYKSRFANDSTIYYIEIRAKLDTTNIQWQEDAANVFRDQWIFSKASFYYSRALRLCQLQDDKDAQKEINLLLRMAHIRKETARYEECLLICDKVLRLCDSISIPSFVNILLKLSAYNMKSTVFRETNNASEMHKNLETNIVPLIIAFGEQGLNDSSMKNEIADRYYVLFVDSYLPTISECGQYFISIQDYKSGEDIYLQLLEISKGLQLKAYSMGSMVELSKIYLITSQMEKSEIMLQEALEINKEFYQKDSTNSTYAIIESELHINLATLYEHQKNYLKCIQELRKVLNIFDKLSNTAAYSSGAYDNQIATTSTKLGNIYAILERDNDAILHLEKAFRIYKPIKNKNANQKQNYLTCVARLSMLYTRKNDKKNAYISYSEFIPLLEELYSNNLSVKDAYVEALGNQSYFALFYGTFENAEQMARESLKLDPTQLGPITNLAAALLLQGKYAAAEKLYSKYKKDLGSYFLQDITEFEKDGIIPNERKVDVERIKKLLSK